MLEKAFSEQIKRIGATLIVSSPWQKPAFLDRAWCLFELMVSCNVQVETTIMLPSAQQRDFVEQLADNWEVVYEALAGIDSRRATAREPKDLKAISRAVESSVGYAGLNKLANGRMLEWLMGSAREEEERLREEGDELALADFQYSRGAMCWQLGRLVRRRASK